MAKFKRGLHKEISAIFDGAPLPKDGGLNQSSSAAPQRYSSDKGPPSDKTGLRTAAIAKPAAPEPKIDRTPVIQQPSQDRPKSAPAAEQPRVGAVAATGPRGIGWQQALKALSDKFFAPKSGVLAAKQKKLAILIPVLFIVLICIFIKVLVPGTKGVQTTNGPATAAAATGSIREIDWQIPAPYPATLRDPMRPGPVPTLQTQPGQAANNQIVVRGIVYSESNPSVIIGSQIVHEGEHVLGARLVKINRDSVEFERDGEKWTQKVQQ